MNTLDTLKEVSNKMRTDLIELANSVGNNGAHIGPGLSIIETMAVLYTCVMRIDPTNPLWEDRDRFLLSKGHGSLGYYTALEQAGLISRDDLLTFEVNGGDFPGQPSMNLEKGIEISSGSLGHGLAIGIGIALAAKKKSKTFQTYVLMGDGECNEGSIWESAMSASSYKLDNLTAIVDRNDMQSDGRSVDILDMEDFAAKWHAFGFEVKTVDGHDLTELLTTFTAPRLPGKPRVVIAKTVKGKGISFAENNHEWHHNHFTKDQYDQAITEQGVLKC